MEWDRLQLEVERLVKARGLGGLDDADEMLEATPGLSQDQRSALWLYGWSLLPDGAEHARRYVATVAPGSTGRRRPTTT